MTAQSPKFRSKWWYAFPILLGVLGGIVAWFALNKDDKKLAKNCLIIGVVLFLIELVSLVSFLGTNNLNLIAEFNTLFEQDDLGFQFKIESP